MEKFIGGVSSGRTLDWFHGRLPALAMCVAALAVVVLVAPDATQAQSVTFQKIADTDTPKPGGSGTFASFSEPAINSGHIAFTDNSIPSIATGVFKFSSGSLSVVANRNTAIPDDLVSPARTFLWFGLPAVDETGVVSFFGQTNTAPGHSGIYTDATGSLSTVVDSRSLPPGSTPTFWSFPQEVAISAGKTAFAAYGNIFELPIQEGVYTGTTLGLELVADRNTPAPTGSGSFSDIMFNEPAFTHPAIGMNQVAFKAIDGSGLLGIFKRRDANLTSLVTTNTTIPGYAVPFSILNGFDFDGEKLVFLGSGQIFDYRGGFFKTDGATVERVVDSTVRVPGQGFNFFNFQVASIDRNRVAFMAFGPPYLSYVGLFYEEGGQIRKIIEYLDTLDGKTVTWVAIRRDALSGDQVAFLVGFGDGSAGIYVANLPAPLPVPSMSHWGSIGLVLVALVVGIAVRRNVANAT